MVGRGSVGEDPAKLGPRRPRHRNRPVTPDGRLRAGGERVSFPAPRPYAAPAPLSPAPVGLQQYVLPLVSILVGLALTDLAKSLHLLLRARGRVRWHPFPVVVAALAALYVVQFWWAFYRVGQRTPFTHYLVVLVLLATLVVLFLLCAAALPDAVPEAGLDLRAYYFDQRRYVFGLFAGYVVLSTAVLAGSAVAVGEQQYGSTAGYVLRNVGYLALTAPLAFTRRPRVHGVCLGLHLAVRVGLGTLAWL